MLILVAALAALQQDTAAADDAIARFRTAMKTATTSEQRSQAVMDLAKTPHSKTFGVVAAALKSDDATVREPAARALLEFPDHKKGAAQALVGVLPASQADVSFTTIVVRTLGDLGDPSVLASVHRFLTHRNHSILGAAVDATAKLPSASSIDALIGVIKREERVIGGNSGGAVAAGGDVNGNNKVVVGANTNAVEASEAMIARVEKALSAITGESHSGSKAWEQWWARAKPTFKLPK